MGTLRFLSLLLLLWCGYRWLERIHFGLFALVLLVIACNTFAMWLLRFEPQRAKRLARWSFASNYFALVARLSGVRGTRIATPREKSREWLLDVPRAYARASQRAKQLVRGHDEAIDQVFSRIELQWTLRQQRRRPGPMPPIASFLLVGPEGIGKRYLCRVLATLLLKSGNILAFDCARTSPTALFGSKDAPSELMRTVQDESFQVLLFEHVDTAPQDVVRCLLSVLKSGVHRMDQTQECSFANTVWFFATTKGIESLSSLSPAALGERPWHDKATEMLTRDAGIDATLLNTLSAIVPLRPPTDQTKAEVVSLLLQKEASQHGISLSYVDPLIIAAESIRVAPESGFARLPQDIKKLMTRPLLSATRQNRKTMALHVDFPATLSRESNHE